MNTTRGNHWPRFTLVAAIKVVIVFVISMILASTIKLVDALHPPRTIPQGNTLRKYKIDYRSVDLITEDGIRLSAWYTPPQNGALILLAHGYGNKRPVYIVHSTADMVAPPEAGEKLFNAAKEPRYLWLAEDVPHMTIYLDNPRRYQRRLIDFFDEWLLGKSG